MKKIISFLISLVLMLCSSIPSFASDGNNVFTISKKNVSHEVSKSLYGVSLDDISYASDGGLVSNLIHNGSFEYYENPEAFWIFDGIDTVLSNENPINANNPSYETITVNGSGTLENIGFPELYENKSYDYDEDKANTSDMGFKEGVSYEFSCYVKNIDFSGTISVYLNSKSNSSNITQLSISSVGTSVWTRISADLTSSAEEDGSLVISFEGKGSLDLDFVSLVPENSYGFKTDEWKYTALRPDFVDALKNLKPSFIRFSVGCSAAGENKNNPYSWKSTIGPLEERVQGVNLWKDSANGNDCSTGAMGYHEYFQLCEDLGAEAVPVVSAGMMFRQSASDDDEIAALKPETDEFTNYVQDVLDLIEYANGNSQTSYWGALRAGNGHEQPFNMKYLAVGNENSGDIYFRNFDEIYKAVKKKYPDITIISCAGVYSENNGFDSSRDIINEKYSDTFVDEHYYTTDDFMFLHNDWYDSYDRDGAGVIIGEYSAKCKNFGKLITKNNIWSAAEGASFLTGIERNSDIVKMTSYAPTFAKVNANASEINLIWFDSQSVVLTPDYYVRMLFSNNLGEKYIQTDLDTAGDKQKIYQSVTVDEERQVMYIKLVNTASSKRLKINLDGFDSINYVSNQSLSNRYKSAFNDFNKQRVAPAEEEIEAGKNSFDITLEANSINVVRIAYGDNTGDSLYNLPDNISLETKSYAPAFVIIIAVVLPLCFIFGGALGFFAYRKVLRKRRKE